MTTPLRERLEAIVIPDWMRVVLLGVMVAMVLNWFISFPDEVKRLGGAAMWGYAREGHFFLGWGRDTVEVSEAIWNESWVHCAVLILSWPAMLALLATRAFVPLRVQQAWSPVHTWVKRKRDAGFESHRLGGPRTQGLRKAPRRKSARARQAEGDIPVPGDQRVATHASPSDIPRP
jgi:hypothetical protein